MGIQLGKMLRKEYPGAEESRPDIRFGCYNPRKGDFGRVFCTKQESFKKILTNYRIEW